MNQAYQAGVDALESSDELEFLAGESAWMGESDEEAVFDEVEEMELAAQLLEVNDEAELDQFLGKLIKRAGRAVGKVVRSPVGKALGGVLRNVARTALPIAGAALGNLVVPGVGGMVGGKVASMAGRMFGLELEGMSPQDQEFELARRFVRLSAEATRQATTMPPQGPVLTMAKDAVVAAAARHAPGLASGPRGELRSPRRKGGKRRPRPIRRRRYGGGYAPVNGGAAPQWEPIGEHGTWVRRGRAVVLSWA